MRAGWIGFAAGRRRCWLRPEERLRRIRQRDGITEEQARIRMAAQPADEYYIARASLVIRNDGSAAQLRAAAAELAEKMERWSREG